MSSGPTTDLSFLPYPSELIPSTNSLRENSHCVAALNFHAMSSTVRLVGSRPASSQNRLTPSANILSSSTESSQEEEGGGREGVRWMEMGKSV